MEAEESAETQPHIEEDGSSQHIQSLRARIADQDAALVALRSCDESARVEAMVSERTRDFMIEALVISQSEKPGVTVCSWCGWPSPLNSDEHRAHVLRCEKSPAVQRISEIEDAYQDLRDAAEIVSVSNGHERYEFADTAFDAFSAVMKRNR